MLMIQTVLTISNWWFLMLWHLWALVICWFGLGFPTSYDFAARQRTYVFPITKAERNNLKILLCARMGQDFDSPSHPGGETGNRSTWSRGKAVDSHVRGPRLEPRCRHYFNLLVDRSLSWFEHSSTPVETLPNLTFAAHRDQPIVQSWQHPVFHESPSCLVGWPMMVIHQSHPIPPTQAQ